MKDLEKIKSEEVAAQVQDANPGNFAIEQEVAQLVGATVPAPTEPSADDARELGAQLLVFLRRALLPIRSALRTAVAAIYAHLDSRCTDYTPAAYDPFRLPACPYDPMRPLTPRTLPNLLTALTAFSARKISNGSAPNDGIPDGISLAHLLCEPASVVELKDDNYGWTLNRSIANLRSIFTNLVKMTLNCSKANGNCISNASIQNMEFPSLEEISDASNVANAFIRETIYGYTPPTKTISIPKLRKIVNQCFYYTSHASAQTVEELEFSSLEYVSGSTGCAYCAYSGDSKLKRVSFPVIETCNSYFYTAGVRGTGLLAGSFSALEHIYIGYKDNTGSAITLGSISVPALWDVELKQGFGKNLNISAMNPSDLGTTFLQNFREHIALRLTDNGTGLTLTLSQAVRNAIHAAESTYGIENIIVTQKGWTISPAPN